LGIKLVASAFIGIQKVATVSKRLLTPVMNKPPIHEAYAVAFVEQPSFLSLNTSEYKWFEKLTTQPNI